MHILEDTLENVISNQLRKNNCILWPYEGSGHSPHPETVRRYISKGISVVDSVPSQKQNIHIFLLSNHISSRVVKKINFTKGACRGNLQQTEAEKHFSFLEDIVMPCMLMILCKRKTCNRQTLRGTQLHCTCSACLQDLWFPHAVDSSLQTICNY